MRELPRLDVVAAMCQLNARAWFTPAYRDYAYRHHLDVERMSGFAGATAVIPIIDCTHGRFEFGKIGVDPLGFVCEAYGPDGETTIDLVAWPVDNPGTVLSMFGRAAWLGAWAAWNPATYYLGKALDVHRTPLEWLKSGCMGAAVVTPRLAAREMMDLPGKIEPRDEVHYRELLAIAASVMEPSPINMPLTRRSA